MQQSQLKGPSQCTSRLQPLPPGHPPVARTHLPCCRKETHCEFCDSRLPDWKGTLTPQCGANAPAVMNVNFDGRTYSFEVRRGPWECAAATARVP